MKDIIISLTVFILSSVSCFAQRDTIKVKNIETAMDISLRQFRMRLNDPKLNVLCIVENEINMSDISFSKNDFVVKNVVSAKMLNNKTGTYLLKFFVTYSDKTPVVTVAKYKITKSNKEVVYTDLLSRDYYRIW